MWSQCLITLVTLIIGTWSCSQCTCIVVPRKFSMRSSFVSFHPHYLQPHKSKAFSSRASRPFKSFSFLTDPLRLLPLSQGLPFQSSFFLQNPLFLPCLLRTEPPLWSNQCIFLFYNPQLTKHRNNVSEWTSGAINVLHVTSERCSISTCKLYVLEIFNQSYTIFYKSSAAWFLMERMNTKRPWWR